MVVRSAALSTLALSRYALLRTYRRDGTAVDTPIWFRLDHDIVVFRTKRGPKTRRLAVCSRVELRACDYRGRLTGNGLAVTGRASILGGECAEAANRALRDRYGWQWNVIPLIKVPGVTNVHRGLTLRDKVRRAKSATLWPDSVIVRVDIDQPDDQVRPDRVVDR